jgi:membrane protein DedA with SNARE-associated domain
MVPFLFAAGAMQYPVKKFLAALFIGRIARYTTLAFLAAHYGRQIILLLRHGHALLLATVGLLITIAGITFVLLRSAKSSKPAEG